MKISICNIILFMWLMLYSFTAYTQNKTIDSLQKVLAVEKEDMNKVNTLNCLSYDIIKVHGGELKVETKEGEYAEFTIKLPAT